MNINWGLFPEPEVANPRDKDERRTAKLANAQAAFAAWRAELDPVASRVKKLPDPYGASGLIGVRVVDVWGRSPGGGVFHPRGLGGHRE